MICYICGIDSCTCKNLFASPRPGAKKGFWLLCAGAKVAPDQALNIKLLREEQAKAEQVQNDAK